METMAWPKIPAVPNSAATIAVDAIPVDFICVSSKRLCASQRAAASADQVYDQDHESYDEQHVDEAAGDMETEAQQPQDQNDNKKCPQHMFSFSALRAPGAGHSPRPGRSQRIHPRLLFCSNRLGSCATNRIQERMCCCWCTLLAGQNAL